MGSSMKIFGRVVHVQNFIISYGVSIKIDSTQNTAFKFGEVRMFKCYKSKNFKLEPGMLIAARLEKRWPEDYYIKVAVTCSKNPDGPPGKLLPFLKNGLR